jgi:transposase
MACASVAAAVVICSAALVHAEMIDRVLAVVGAGDGSSRQLITLSDVNAARELGLETAGEAADPVRAVLTKLIDRELVLAEVDRYAPAEPTAAAVDAEVARVAARFPSPDAFGATLTRAGIDQRHLRETLRQNLRMASYLSQRFAAAQDRRDQLISEWMAGLRRRADVIDLYLGT